MNWSHYATYHLSVNSFYISEKAHQKQVKVTTSPLKLSLTFIHTLLFFFINRAKKKSYVDVTEIVRFNSKRITQI